MKNKTNELNIGAYCLGKEAQTEEHIKDIKACGIDFVIGINYQRELLDLLHIPGLGAVVSGVVPRHFGADGSNVGGLEEPPTGDYACALKACREHPAVWAVDIGDEPSCLDFPHLGNVARLLIQRGILPYLNLYPSYGANSGCTKEQVVCQLGCADYPQYLEKYIEALPLSYISFDFYVYSSNFREMVNSFSAVADCARSSGRAIHAVLQVNSHTPEKYISESELRFQAYVALAFGAECISWACYSPGWWYNNVLDQNGQKTEQYKKLARVNRELKELGERYMRYSNQGVYVLQPGQSYTDGNLTFTSDALTVLGKMSNGRDVGYILVKMSQQQSGLFLNISADKAFLDGKEINTGFYHLAQGLGFLELIR